MRILALVLCIGCGSVSSPDHKDAGAIDTPMACTEHSTPQSCGATCMVCPGTGGRQIATCDGTACGLACADTAPVCSDNTCSKINWTFEDGTVDGITPRAPVGLALAVRPHLQSMALAIDVTNLTEVSFFMPICVTGNANFSAKTLSASVYFDGGNTTGQQFYVQASTPQPQNGSFLSPQASVAANMPQMFSAPMSSSGTSTTTTTIVFQAGTFGAQFSGTIWFDDIKLQ